MRKCNTFEDAAVLPAEAGTFNLKRTLVFLMTALAGSFLLVGCETPSAPAGRPTPLEQASTTPAERMPAAQTLPPAPPVPPAREIPMEPAPQHFPTVPIIAPVSEGWLDLAKWCETRGLGQPMHNRGPVPTWSLQLPDGSLQVAAGNHFAHWDGMLVGLGFAARSSRSGLQMCSLDLEKNFIPLASPFYFKGVEKIVVLDPGHGGADGGTRSPQTLQVEKNLTLDWALRVKRLLIGTGWTVLLTRTNDIDLTLAQRVAFTDDIQPDLFVSLHFNAMEASSKSHEEAGVETYCLTPTGLPSNITRGFEDQSAKVFPNNQFDSENLQWAVRFHHQLLALTGAHDRGVRRARFMAVVREQRRPAVLIEGGYLSNPHEAKLLADASYREQLAKAVAAAIARQ